jgi:hypothetical protein
MKYYLNTRGAGASKKTIEADSFHIGASGDLQFFNNLVTLSGFVKQPIVSLAQERWIRLESDAPAVQATVAMFSLEMISGSRIPLMDCDSYLVLPCGTLLTVRHIGTMSGVTRIAHAAYAKGTWISIEAA